MNLLKYISNELCIPIIAVGTRDSFKAVAADPQTANRFEPRFPPRWQMSEGYFSLLASYQRTLPLCKESGLVQMALAEKVLSMSEGLIGEISTILVRAFEEAVVGGEERITMKILSGMEWVLPSKRG